MSHKVTEVTCFFCKLFLVKLSTESGVKINKYIPTYVYKLIQRNEMILLYLSRNVLL